MKIQFISIGLLAIILLVKPSLGLTASDHRLVLRDDHNATDNNVPTTTPLPEKTEAITTVEGEPSGNDTATTVITPPVVDNATTTVTPIVTPNTTTTIAPITTTTTVPVVTSITDAPTTTNSSVLITTSTVVTPSTTTKGPGRKFDGPSFIGGMILVVGLGAIIYLVVRYVRRNNDLPYSNLQ